MIRNESSYTSSSFSTSVQVQIARRYCTFSPPAFSINTSLKIGENHLRVPLVFHLERALGSGIFSQAPVTPAHLRHVKRTYLHPHTSAIISRLTVAMAPSRNFLMQTNPNGEPIYSRRNTVYGYKGIFQTVSAQIARQSENHFQWTLKAKNKDNFPIFAVAKWYNFSISYIDVFCMFH